MASKGRSLLQGRVLPNYDLVIRIPVRAHDLFGVLGKHEVAHLRTRVYTVDEGAVQRVPKLDCFVG